MKKLIASVVLATTTALSVSSASAWWDMPFFGNGVGDGFGDGAINFNMNTNARSHVRGLGYGYNAPYYGYGPYAYTPYAAVPPQAMLQAPIAPNTATIQPPVVTPEQQEK